MKNLYFILIILLGFVFHNPNATAQQGYAFQKSDVVINAGIGLGTTFAFTGSLGLPFGGGVEYGITDGIGVGGFVGYASGGDLSVFYIGGKGSYHFNELLNIKNENLDLYAGLGIYYRKFSFSGFDFGLGSGFGFGSGIRPGFHIGGRYYFSEKFGVQAELGNSYGWLTAGVVLKL